MAAPSLSTSQSSAVQSSLDAQIDELAADPFDDELLENFRLT